MKLELNDLKPQLATFELSDKPGKTYTLAKFSLAKRIWCNQRFGDKIGKIFEKQSLPELAELAHFLLLDKADFPTFLEFADSVVTVEDQIQVVKALLKTIGIDDALIKKLSEDKSPNEESPNPAT